MTDKKVKGNAETHKIKDGVKRLLWHHTGAVVLFGMGAAIAIDAYLHGDMFAASIAAVAVVLGGYWLYRTNNNITEEIHDTSKAYFLMKA
jgi:hypothetical protein